MAIHKDDGVYSDLKVMKSAAGYYIGRTFREHGDTFDVPGSRESDYFPTREMAQAALESGDFERDVPENRSLKEGLN